MDLEELTLHIKTEIDIEKYVTSYLGYVKKNKTTFSCPACGSSDAVKRKGKETYLTCFSCGVNGNIIDLTMQNKSLDFILAIKDICKNENLIHDLDNNETTAETEEELEQRKKAYALKQKAYEKKQVQDEQNDKKAKQKAINYMTIKAPKFQNDLDFFVHNKELDQLIYNKSTTYMNWMDLYVGYDNKHKTICILNRILDDKHTTYNIKHRLKYKWDGNKHLDTRTDGKWISNIDATTYAFPFEYFKEQSKTDNTVFIVEGEKDALNLLSYDINVLTLGGVSTSWENHKEILKDKTVYIWFDHDNAGYENSIKRYNELKGIAKEIFIVLFYQINTNLPNKYDISNYLFANKFKTKEELFDKIKFSISTLTTSLIEDIEDYTGLDLKDYYFNQPIKKFSNIKKNWLVKDKDNIPVNITTVKGEKDIKGLADFLDRFKIAKKDSRFSGIKEDLLDKLVVTKKDTGKK